MQHTRQNHNYKQEILFLTIEKDIQKMATFNQQGQTVETQYNAENIHFGEANNIDDFIRQLKQLQTEFSKAIETKHITDEKTIDADAFLKKAIQQAEIPQPDKKTIIEHLNSAKDLVTNANGLVLALSAAVTTAAALF